MASLGQKWPRTPFVFERYAGNGSANKNFAAAEDAAAWVARVEKHDTNTEGMAVWKEAELDRAIVLSSMRMKFDSVEISVFHLPQSISATNPQKKNDKHGNVAVSCRFSKRGWSINRHLCNEFWKTHIPRTAAKCNESMVVHNTYIIWNCGQRIRSINIKHTCGRGDDIAKFWNIGWENNRTMWKLSRYEFVVEQGRPRYIIF